MQKDQIHMLFWSSGFLSTTQTSLGLNQMANWTLPTADMVTGGERQKLGEAITLHMMITSRRELAVGRFLDVLI